MRKYLVSAVLVAFGLAPVGVVLGDNNPFPHPPK